MLTISKPCSENWDKMPKTNQGKFCDKCQHDVIDFSKMTNEKVKQYFETNSSKNVCGNFKTSQLSKNRSKYKLVAVFLAFVSFWMDSCATRTKGLVRAPEGYKNCSTDKKVTRTLGTVSIKQKIETQKDTISKK